MLSRVPSRTTLLLLYVSLLFQCSCSLMQPMLLLLSKWQDDAAKGFVTTVFQARVDANTDPRPAVGRIDSSPRIARAAGTRRVRSG